MISPLTPLRRFETHRLVQLAGTVNRQLAGTPMTCALQMMGAFDFP